MCVTRPANRILWLDRSNYTRRRIRVIKQVLPLATCLHSGIDHEDGGDVPSRLHGTTSPLPTRLGGTALQVQQCHFFPHRFHNPIQCIQYVHLKPIDSWVTGRPFNSRTYNETVTWLPVKLYERSRRVHFGWHRKQNSCSPHNGSNAQNVFHRSIVNDVEAFPTVNVLYSF